MAGVQGRALQELGLADSDVVLTAGQDAQVMRYLEGLKKVSYEPALSLTQQAVIAASELVSPNGAAQ